MCHQVPSHHDRRRRSQAIECRSGSKRYSRIYRLPLTRWIVLLLDARTRWTTGNESGGRSCKDVYMMENAEDELWNSLSTHLYPVCLSKMLRWITARPLNTPTFCWVCSACARRLWVYWRNLFTNSTSRARSLATFTLILRPSISCTIIPATTTQTLVARLATTPALSTQSTKAHVPGTSLTSFWMLKRHPKR